MNSSSRLGTTLIEVIVSLFVISTVSVGSITIVQTAFNSAMMTRNRIAARNLAREGIEGVRKIISTNLIKYSDPKCWRHPPTTSKPDCVINYLTGKYKLNFSQPADAQFEVLLELTTDNFKTGNPPNLQLNPNFQLKRQTGKNEFIGTGAATGAVKEKFHRIIEISYIDSNPNKMKVVSTVAWMRGEQIIELKITKTFYNTY